jgi:hypothetical protein
VEVGVSPEVPSEVDTALSADEIAPGVAGKPSVLEGITTFAPAPGGLGEALKRELDIGRVSASVGVPAPDRRESTGIGDQRITTPA